MVNTFWQGKRVLLTGHTGFKGTWAALWLKRMGADVTGIALAPDGGFFTSLAIEDEIRSHVCDIRDKARLGPLLHEASPEIVIHMAAQSLVPVSYREPLATFETNIMGTANLLCLLRGLASPPRVILVVTSDKVYENTEDGSAFAEHDRFGGDDPYSASKACTEIVAASIRQSLFSGSGSVIATARAGNVIGGGDWSMDRLIPDMIRGIARNEPVILRNPSATRPWQHVFDVLDGYFRHVEALWNNKHTPLALNFGPSRDGCITVAEMVHKMEHALGMTVSLETPDTPVPAEKKLLRLDAGLAARSLGWCPRLSTGATIEWTAAWYSAWMRGDDMRAFSMNQLVQYEEIPA